MVSFATFDPPKKDAKQAIENLRQLGVQFKLITGDNALVADNIAKQTGFEKPVILTGLQMRYTSDRAFQHQAIFTDVFTEIESNQKERIIVFLNNQAMQLALCAMALTMRPRFMLPMLASR